LRDLYIIDSKYKSDYIVARGQVMIDNYDEYDEEVIFNIKLLHDLLTTVLLHENNIDD